MTGRVLARSGLAVGLLLILFGRPWAHGIPLAATGLFWVFVLVEVALPGLALAWATGGFRRDPTLLVGQGCSLGLALQAVAYFASRMLGVAALETWTPLAAGAAALALGRRRREDPEAPSLGASPTLPLLGLLLVVSTTQPLFSERHLGDTIPVDMLFHAGNAAEVQHRWPPENPRIAGLPLKYQLLAYAMPAGATSWAGLSVADSLLGVAPLLWVMLAVIQVYNAGRALFRDGVVGLLGAGIFACYADPGRLLGLGPGAFNSYFTTGFYGSPTTVCGFILLASLAVTLSEWLTGVRRFAVLLPLGLLSLAASATKASVLPTVGGGLLALALWAWPRNRNVAHGALIAITVVVLCGGPVTLWMSTGEGSYQGMLRFGVGAAMKQSEFTRWFTRAVGGPPLAPGWVSPAALLWLVGYLGLAGMGFLAWLTGGRPMSDPPKVWALGVAGTGAVLGLLLEAREFSQLFFLYNAQLMLALFAGAGLASAFREPRRTWAAILVCAALPALQLAIMGPLEGWREDRKARVRPWSPVEAEYVNGLAWLRGHATRGSVVFADNGSLLLSGFGECRTFYENGLYSPKSGIPGEPPPDEAYADRVLLQTRLLRNPDAEAAEAVERRLPSGTTVRIVADSVQARLEGGMERPLVGPVPPRRLFPPDLFELEFANAAMHVYRLRPIRERGTDLPSDRGNP